MTVYSNCNDDHASIGVYASDNVDSDGRSVFESDSGTSLSFSSDSNVSTSYFSGSMFTSDFTT